MNWAIVCDAITSLHSTDQQPLITY